MRKIFILDGLLIVALVGGFVLLTSGKKTPADNQTTQTKKSTPQPTGFNKSQYSTDKVDSLWVVVNKGRQLPSSYIPSDLVVPNVPLNASRDAENMKLRKQAATALESLVKGAAKDKVDLVLLSGYRSYSYQKTVYNGYVSSQGQEAADTFSARPGHSEHQTGLAADIGDINHTCDLEICFGSTPEGKWLAAHANEYGFTIRYQLDKVDITGYQYEPWHLRYVGTELAQQLKDKNQTLEEFFGQPTFTNYPSTIFELHS